MYNGAVILRGVSLRARKMGIKFHCPNGHKLNVKSFLAGKKGVCPKCGTKFRIPATSEPGLVDSDLEETEASASHPAKSNGSGTAAATLVAPVPAAPAVAAAPAAVASAGPAEAAADPIAEAPAAIWYVRPPTGGQYGPARGEIMRKWISEGRVSSDSLVWREGWTDWQSAGKLFPALQAAGSAPAQPAPVVSTTVPLSARSSARTAARYEAKKQTNNSFAIAILAGLGLLCLVLVAVLVFVLMRLK
jgi:GYF domain 2